MLKTLILFSLTSILYVIGGIAMKYSDDYRAGLPTFFVFLFFCLGAGVQNHLMKQHELGTGYVIVLGLEAVFAVIGGAYLFKEEVTLYKLMGMVLVVTGIALLKVEHLFS